MNKVVIVGHVDHGRTALSHAITSMLQHEGVRLDELPAKRKSQIAFEPEPFKFTAPREMISCAPYQAPMTRRERRKLARTKQ